MSEVEQLPFSHIGPYRVLEEIGRGGTAAVYKVVDGENKLYALKLLHFISLQDARWSTRFQREFRLLSRLQHENLIRVYDYGEDHDRPYYVMDYIEGVNLWTFYRTSIHGLPTYERLKLISPLLAQIITALDYIHRHRVVHQDLKPANILLTQNGTHVYLVDFGLARDLRDAVLFTSPGFVGTLGYSAPEIIERSRLDGRTDLYSLGVILYILLADRRPLAVEGRSFDQLLIAVRKEVPTHLLQLVPDIPPFFAQIIHKMMAKDPAERFANARELWRELLPLFSEFPPSRPIQEPNRTVPIPVISSASPEKQSPVAPLSKKLFQSEEPLDSTSESIDSFPIYELQDSESLDEIDEQEFHSFSPAVETIFLHSSLIGRDSETQRFEELILELIEGKKANVVLFYGIPGIGKSFLLEELARSILHLPYTMTHLRIRKSTTPYSSLSFFLRKLFEQSSQQLLQQEYCQALGHYLPQLYDILNYSPAPTEQVSIGILEALFKTISSALREKPHIWLIDDLHHADFISQELLRSLLLKLLEDTSIPFLFLATLGYQDGDEELPFPMPSHEQIERHYLLPFSEEEERLFISKIVGHAPDYEELKRIRQITRGIPLRTHELIHQRNLIVEAQVSLSSHHSEEELQGFSPYVGGGELSESSSISEESHESFTDLIECLTPEESDEVSEETRVMPNVTSQPFAPPSSEANPSSLTSLVVEDDDSFEETVVAPSLLLNPENLTHEQVSTLENADTLPPFQLSDDEFDDFFDAMFQDEELVPSQNFSSYSSETSSQEQVEENDGEKLDEEDLLSDDEGQTRVLPAARLEDFSQQSEILSGVRGDFAEGGDEEDDDEGRTAVKPVYVPTQRMPSLNESFLGASEESEDDDEGRTNVVSSEELLKNHLAQSVRQASLESEGGEASSFLVMDSSQSFKALESKVEQVASSFEEDSLEISFEEMREEARIPKEFALNREQYEGEYFAGEGALEDFVEKSDELVLVPLLKKRLEMMPEEFRDDLARMALLGEEFTLEELQGVVRSSQEELFDLLNAALALRLLELSEDTERDERYRFLHPIFVKILLSSIDVDDWEEASAQAAEAMNRVREKYGTEDDAELIALRYADGGNLIKGILWQLRAFEHALLSNSPELLIDAIERTKDLLSRCREEKAQKRLLYEMSIFLKKRRFLYKKELAFLGFRLLWLGIRMTLKRKISDENREQTWNSLCRYAEKFTDSRDVYRLIESPFFAPLCAFAGFYPQASLTSTSSSGTLHDS